MQDESSKKLVSLKSPSVWFASPPKFEEKKVGKDLYPPPHLVDFSTTFLILP